MLRKLLPHAAIILSAMYLVFFLIDRVNKAMAFINNEITKHLLLVLCAIAVIEALWLIRDERRKVRQSQARAVEARRRQQERQRDYDRDRSYYGSSRGRSGYTRYR